MPRIVPALLSIALVSIALAACNRADEPPVPSGNVAARLTVPTMDGPAFDPQALGGKPSLVVFWRPSCPHCIAELPDAIRAAADRGANAVAVQVTGQPAQGKEALERAGWTGPILIDDGSLRADLKITAVPYTLVLRPDGTARRAFLGRQSYDTLSSALASAR